MKDILTNTDYDLVIAQGDFFIGESAAQHVEFLFLSKQGEWKESPLTGCYIQRAQNGSVSRSLDRHIRIQLEADGFAIEKLQLSEKGVNVKGKYKQ
jgi:hypothetical protein|nr:MAG TPA: hypothetical protein [Caudoviricetes sp.]DAN68711.1 MAG TPA: hypothetical protein [Caudoviricetes sp.]